MKYIAYGSNMSTGQMEYRCPDARLVDVGRIHGAQLEFFIHATVELSQIKDAFVPVAVWEISERDEKRLDRYEGFPNYYIKEEWPVTLADGSDITGMIYLMRTKRGDVPAMGYYEGIRSAYEDLGLRSEIKSALESALRRSMYRRFRLATGRRAK
jgi:gamma-glutamylcyclotransferase (GGCT)/AIG2-like uncharacterized protein YtfP